MTRIQPHSPVAELRLVFFLTCAFLLTSACSAGFAATQERQNRLGQQVSSRLIDRENPFKVRPFSPTSHEYRGKGISYGPFRKGQRPGGKGPTRKQIQEDLRIIAKDKWQMIRTYGTEPFTEKVCDVIQTEKLPIKLMLGAWIATEKEDAARKKANQQQIEQAIALANKYPDVVAAVSVANESQVFWSFHKVETDTLIQYVRHVRRKINQPVTVADDFKYWSLDESRKTCKRTGLHCHPCLCNVAWATTRRFLVFHQDSV